MENLILVMVVLALMATGGQQYNYKGYEGCVIVRAPILQDDAFGSVGNLIKDLIG